MPGLKLYTSNRLEILSAKLAAVLQTPLSSPLERETIVVQSKGMERWLSFELARHNGICANCRFPFPNSFFETILDRIFPQTEGVSLFTPKIMTFRIMRLMHKMIKQGGFDPLQSYLSDDQRYVKLFQLSEKIADGFDQYLVFRPDMILQWENKPDGLDADQKWQADLWRALVSETGMKHRARLRLNLFEKIQNRSIPDTTLSTRISVFGISYLPRFYLEVFQQLSELVEVNIFVLNPCREYWADIVTPQEKKQFQQHYRQIGPTDFNLHLETGNSLLASMGTLGRQFFEAIHEFDCETEDRFVENGEKSLLARVQDDILYLRNPRDLEDQEKMDRREEDMDPSIQIHSCHSPAREIEVLFDHLLALFEADPGLKPHEIAVLVPEIETYAPFIQSVFHSEASATPHIPFNLSDRGIYAESDIIQAFFAIIDLHGTRFEAYKILGLLEFEAIRKKFDLASEDIPVIENWIRDTQIRWGIDTREHRRLGLPEFHENTWKAGLERMLVGFAMPGEGRYMFNNILPYDHIEGQDAVLLGRLLAFYDALEKIFSKLNNNEKLVGWNKILNNLIEEMLFQNDPAEKEFQVLRQHMDDLSSLQTLSGFETKLEFDVIQAYLRHQLEQTRTSSGFISGGVTFCAMLPMRSIPFKVIGMLGMNHDAFPREHHRPGFDLIAKYPSRGDRSKRNDDRYLFLETLMSARKRLYISYIGQNLQDNTCSPPSVLVSELIDYLSENYGLDPVKMVVRHRLQPFSRIYFDQSDQRMFSYSRDNLAAAEMLCGSVKKIPPFIDADLPAPSDRYKILDVETLTRFWIHPCRFFLRKRFNLFLDDETASIEEHENFDLDPLSRFSMVRSMLEMRQTDMDRSYLLAIQKASGVLPHGHIGDMLFDEMNREQIEFTHRIDDMIGGGTPKTMEITLTMGDFVISGRLDHIFPQGQVIIDRARIRSKHFLKAWIRHLFICSAKNADLPLKTFHIGKEKTFVYSNHNHESKMLEKLLNLYWEGLSRPLPFFPETSHEYVRRHFRSGESRGKALFLARKKYLGSSFQQMRSENEDPYNALCFKEKEPLDDRFAALAECVFLPLLNSRQTLAR